MSDARKPIFEHLEELRKRILFSLFSVILLSALSYTFSEKILSYLAKYVRTLVFISPQEGFLAHLKISFFCGLILSSPVILFNLLRFIWVALKKRERRAFLGYLCVSIFLFVAGAGFSFYIALPAAMKFLLGFSSGLLKPYISVARYVSFSGLLLLAFSVAFETPLFIVLLTRFKIINSQILRKKRRYFIVVLFILAAMLTPPDVITQLLLAVPLIVLYEISIIFAVIAEKKRFT